MSAMGGKRTLAARVRGTAEGGDFSKLTASRSFFVGPSMRKPRQVGSGAIASALFPEDPT
jgi:hypothetical protein